MKKAGLIAAAVLAATLASAPLLAQDGMNPMPMDHSTMGGPAEPGKYGEMMMKRQKTTEEMMGMMKETMTILRDLKHTPTAEQKEKLNDMIKRMDGMMKEHEETMKKMKEGWEKKEKAPEKKEKMNQMEGY